MAMTAPRAGAAAGGPADVRLMNAVATAVFAAAALGAGIAAVLWLMRSPLFPIRHIQLEGEMAHNSVPTIRANAAPLLAGNFFGIDLAKARAAFETVPWVRRAEVRRVWPGTLRVRLEEHRAAALWEGPAGLNDDSDDVGGDRLVNSFGEVFEANVGDVEDEALPRLAGPEGSAAQMLAMAARLQPEFEPLGWALQRLTLSHRGSWRAVLDTGAVIELGRGSDDEVLARTQRFARTLTQVTARWKQPLDHADLRHADGYALRLRGVTVGAVDPKTR